MGGRGKRWTGKVLLKYSLVQVPSLVLLALVLVLIRQWADLPRWLFWGVLALWIIKDAILFPFVRKAYEPAESRAGELPGLLGTTRERLNPGGYILVRGELWRAEISDGHPPIEAGEPVRVVERRGLTLIVERDLAETE